MGTVYYKNKDGRSQPFKIAGESPTPEEEDRIAVHLGLKQPEPGIGEAFSRNFFTFDEQVQKAGGVLGAFAAERAPNLFGDPKDYWDYVDRKSKEISEEGWSPEKGVLDADTWYDSVRALSAAAGSSLPATLIGAGAGIATAPLGGAGAFAVASGLGALASAPQMLNENVDAQRANAEFSDEDVDWGKAFTATVFNSVIESATDQVLFKMGAGVGALGRKAVSEAIANGTSKALAKLKAITPEVAKVGAFGALQGGVEESIQQAVTRWQAELPLLDDEAKKQYLEAGVSGAILEGLLGGGVAAINMPFDRAYNKVQLQREKAAQYNNEVAKNLSDRFVESPENSSRFFTSAAESFVAGPDFDAAPEAPATPQINERKYNEFLGRIQKAPKISKNQILASARSQKADSKEMLALFEEAQKRGDIIPTGKNNKFFKPAGIAERDYIVKPIPPKPSFVLKAKNKEETYQTRQEAEKAAADAGIKKFDIEESKGVEQHGIFEIRHDSSGKLIGKRLLETHSTPEAAKASIKSIDPLYDPSVPSIKRRSDSRIAKSAKQFAEREADQIQTNLRSLLSGIIGRNAATVNVVSDQTKMPGYQKGYLIEGVTSQKDGDNLITLATNFLDPSIPTKEKEAAIASIGHHEVVHFLRDAGMVSPKEWSDLVRTASKRKMPGQPFTYYDAAVTKDAGAITKAQLPPAQMRDRMEEEAVAEMFRDYMRDPNKFSAKQRGIIQRILDFILSALKVTREDRGVATMQNIAAGKFADRAKGSMGPIRDIGSVKFSRVPVPPFYIKSAKALFDIQMNKGSGAQWYNALKKMGVKAEELSVLGIEELPGTFTKEELGDHIKAHNIRMNETTYTTEAENGETSNRQRIEFLDNQQRMLMHEYGILYRQLTIARMPLEHYWPTPSLIRNAVESGDFVDTIIDDQVIEKIRNSNTVPSLRDGILDVLLKIRSNDKELESLIEQDDVDAYNDSNTQYDLMRLSGTIKKYKEFIFRIPSELQISERSYETGHWPGWENILMHVRMTERAEKSKKILVIEELQTDWLSEAGKFGYTDEYDYDEIVKLKDKWVEWVQEKYQVSERDAKRVVETDGRDILNGSVENDELRFATFEERQYFEDAKKIYAAKNALPRPPFGKNWKEYAFKRMIRYAAEEGMDEIIWPGSTEAVAEIEWENHPVDEVADIKEENPTNRVGPFRPKIGPFPPRLKVGGSDVTGIIKHYTEILPNIAKKIGQQFGTAPYLELPQKTRTQEKTEARSVDWVNDGFNNKKYLFTSFAQKLDIYTKKVEEKYKDSPKYEADIRKKIAQLNENMQKALPVVGKADDLSSINFDELLGVTYPEYVALVDTVIKLNNGIRIERANRPGGMRPYPMWRFPISESLKDHALYTGFEFFSAVRNPKDFPEGSSVQAMPRSDASTRVIATDDILKDRDVVNSDEFKNWFRNSYATDKKGGPLTLYHGTSKDKDFTKFNAPRNGIWFTPNPQEASTYAEENDSQNYKYDGRTYVKTNTASRIVPVYLSLQNPYISEGLPESLMYATNYKKAQSEYFDKLKAQGYDSFVQTHNGEPAIYVAFKPEQIKSIYNKGTFGIGNPDIRYSAVKDKRYSDFISKRMDQAGDNAVLRRLNKEAAIYDTGHSTYGAPLFGDEPYDAPRYIEIATEEGSTPILNFVRNPNTGKKEPIIAQLGGQWVPDGFSWPVGYGMRHAMRNLDAFESPDPISDVVKALQRTSEFTMGKGVFAEVETEIAGKPAKIVLRRKDAPIAMGSLKQGDPVWALQDVVDNPRNQAFFFSAYPDPKYSASKQGYAALPEDALDHYYKTVQYDNLSRFLQDKVYKNLDRISSAVMRKPVSGWTRILTPITKRGIELFQDKFLSLAELVDHVQKHGVITAFSDTYRTQALSAGRIDYLIFDRNRALYQPLFQKIMSLDVTKEQIDTLVKAVPKYDGTKMGVATASGKEGAADALAEHAARKLAREYKSPQQAATEMVLYALHAEERNDVMASRNRELVDKRLPQSLYGSGMTNKEAEQILAWAKQQPWAEQMFGTVVPAFKQIVASTNKTRHEYGLSLDYTGYLAVDSDGNVLREYKNYAPLRGYLDEEYSQEIGEDGEVFMKGGKGYSIRGREDMSATGRQSLATNLIENTILQNMEVVMRGEKNKIGLSFKELISSNAELEVKGPDNEARDMRELAEVVHRMPTKPYYDRKTGKVRQVPMNKPEEYLWVKELQTDKDGNEYVQATAIKIHEPRLRRALMSQSSYGNAGMNEGMKFLLSVNRLLASTRTSWNFNYTLPNLVRDATTAGITMSEYEVDGMVSKIMGNLPSAIKGIRAWLKDSNSDDPMARNFEEFYRHGGKTAVEGIRTTLDIVNGIQDGYAKGLEPPSNWKSARGLGKGVLDFVDRLNDSVENMTRLSVYTALRDKLIERETLKSGIVTQARLEEIRNKAAMAARNATVDFNRGGELKSFMNAYSLFFNASLQGTMALTNALLRSRRVQKIFASAIVAGYLNDMLQSALSDEDEGGKKKYDKLSDYTLEHNVIFGNPFSDGGYITIPIPYFFNSFYNLGRGLSRYMRGGYTAGEALATIGGSFIEGINPMGGNSFLSFVTPTIIDPIVDLTQNTNFMGAPIFPEKNPFGIDERASRRYFNSTSPVYTWFAQALSDLPIIGGEGDYIPGLLEINPNALEYMFEFVGAGTWTFLTQAADMAISGRDRDSLIQKITSGQAWTAQEIPVVRRFVTKPSEREDVGYYIQNRDKVLRVQKSLDAAVKNNDPQLAEALRGYYPDELAVARTIKKIEARRVKIREAINKVKANEALSSSDRRAQLRALQEEQDALIRSANQYFASL